MAYKRLISYFDFIEDEQKRGNAGFVKWEQYEECHILSVFVSGLDVSFHKEAKVYLDESVLGTLSIRNGRAEGTYLLTGEDKEQKEYIDRIKVALDDNRVLIAEFETIQKPQMQEQQQVREVARPQEREPIEKVRTSNPEPVQPEPVENLPVEEEGELWKRLGKSHEPFYPFDKEVECFRIFPKDLNLLQAEYRLFQSNQFLMHGYYNYRHLILFRKKDEADEYWLGVPGIYHEREKMAARMFGFEKFESANKDYRTGDQGYYLVTVK